MKVEILVVKSHSCYFGLPGFIEFCKDFIVFSKAVIGISDKIFTFFINAIIVCIPAVITTEFLVAPSSEFFTTL